MGWAHEVDDGDHGGDKANDIDGPSVGPMTLTDRLLVIGGTRG